MPASSARAGGRVKASVGSTAVTPLPQNRTTGCQPRTGRVRTRGALCFTVTAKREVTVSRKTVRLFDSGRDRRCRPDGSSVRYGRCGPGRKGTSETIQRPKAHRRVFAALRRASCGHWSRCRAPGRKERDRSRSNPRTTSCKAGIDSAVPGSACAKGDPCQPRTARSGTRPGNRSPGPPGGNRVPAARIRDRTLRFFPAGPVQPDHGPAPLCDHLNRRLIRAGTRRSGLALNICARPEPGLRDLPSATFGQERK